MNAEPARTIDAERRARWVETWDAMWTRCYQCAICARDARSWKRVERCEKRYRRAERRWHSARRKAHIDLMSATGAGEAKRPFDCAAWLAALRLAVREQRAARAAYDARDKFAIVGSMLEMALLSKLDEKTRAVARVAEGMVDAAND